MKIEELLQRLHVRIRRRRIIETALTACGLAAMILFFVLRESTKLVTEQDFGFGIVRQSVTYQEHWGILILFAVWFFCISGIFLACDFLLTRLRTVEVAGCLITLYHGLAHTYLYVDGEQKDGGCLVGHHLEAPIPGGTVYVSLGKWSAYMTFSNGHPPVEL